MQILLKMLRKNSTLEASSYEVKNTLPIRKTKTKISLMKGELGGKIMKVCSPETYVVQLPQL